MRADQLIDAVQAYAEAVLERCRDRYGARPTPLLVDAIDAASGEPERWDGHVLSNPARQQNFARLLVGLAALTGQATFRDRAEEWMGHALTALRDPASDLLYWGGHSSWDLAAAAPLQGNHELKCSYPFYRFLHQVDGAATRRFVDGFWHRHVHDWSTLLFNRHGEYEGWDRARRWAGEYRGGPLPIVENRLLSFINTGSDLVCAAAMASLLGGEEAPLAWARRLLGRYEEIRHPDTGLGGYQFNHREPCRVRQSFRPPLGERQDVNETTVLGTGLIQTRYGRAAVTWMNLYEELGPQRGEDFLRMIEVDLAALARHSYDEGRHVFQPLLVDGTRLSPEDAIDGVGYCQPPKLQPVAASGLMFLSYARAFRITRNPRLREVALSLAEGLGWGDLDRDGVPAPTEACGLVGLLDLASADGSVAMLEQTAAAAGQLVRGCGGDLLAAGEGAAAIDAPLPLALLQVAGALLNKAPAVPMLYANTSAFDPKVVIARRRPAA
ncbi:MAG: hypothetical protein ABIL09_11600 [Gemmatimonadota bacterium]